MNSNNNLRKMSLPRGGEVQNIFSMILIVVFVIFIVYLIYNYIRTSNTINNESPVIINGELDAFVARESVELPQIKSGLAQSFSTWIYIQDYNYNYGAPKHILWKGNPSKDIDGTSLEGDGKMMCPQIYLYPESNTLGINTTTTFSGSSPESSDVQNIPLMKWVHICYILNNRSVDVYINGKLERSTALRGIPIITNDNLWVTYGEGGENPGFYGKIGKTQYFTRAITPVEVSDLYNQGPLGNTLYKVTLFDDSSFLKFSSSGTIKE
jgi:hypothetical protein